MSGATIFATILLELWTILCFIQAGVNINKNEGINAVVMIVVGLLASTGAFLLLLEG